MTKRHRLPRDSYIGSNVAFTLCLKPGCPFFVRPEIVAPFVQVLRAITTSMDCAAVYCFMPEHLHLVVLPRSEWAQPLRTVELFKQETAMWLAQHALAVQWQPGFYDEIIRSSSQLKNQVYYVVNNPVRRRLAVSWTDYRFTGAIGLDLREFLAGISC